MTSLALERNTTADATKSAAKRSRKSLVVTALVLATATACIWWGQNWWRTGRFIESTDDAYVGGDVTAISPHAAGFIANILVGDNQRVRAGQILVRLDDRDFQAAAAHAEAILRAEQASLASLQAKYALQSATIRQAAADVTAKTAAAAFASEDDVRYRRLALTSAGSQQAAQKALAADQQGQAAVAASQAALAAANDQVGVLDAEIAQAKAAVAQAQADLRTARLNLGYTQIRSPIDGYVGNRAAQVGAYVSEGAYLLSVIPAHGLWVDANFKEDQLARMKPGQSADVVADIAPDHPFHGRVVSLAPGTGAIFSVIPPENATGNFTKIVQRVPVRIALDGDPKLSILRPGLSTTVSIDTRASAEADK